MSRLAVILAVLWFAVGCAGGRSHPAPSTAAVPAGRDASYYYLLSEMKLKDGSVEEALTALNKAIELDPKQAYLWYKKALLTAAQGDLKTAETDVLKSLEIDPHHPPSLILLGKIRQSRDDPQAAARAFEEALKEDPESEEAHVLLIESDIANRNLSAALKEVEAWVARSPDDVTPLFYEAWIVENLLKDPSRVESVYRKIIEREPDNLRALSALADFYIGRKKDAKALEIFSEMESLAPQDASLKLKIALMYFEHKRYNDAIAKLQDLKRIHSDPDRITYYLGILYEGAKRIDDAEKEFATLQPGSAFYKDAQLHRAYLRMKEDGPQDPVKVREAMKILEEAIQNQPAVATYYEYLAEIYRDQGDLDLAVDLLRRGIRKSPEKEPLYYALGVVYDRAGRFEACLTAMKKVLALNPENAGAMNYIGYSFADRGIRLDEALSYLEKAAALEPDNGYILDSLGWVYFRRGDSDKALALLRKARELAPEEATVPEHQGDIYVKLGRRPDAIRCYRQATDLLRKKNGSADDLKRVEKKIGEQGA